MAVRNLKFLVFIILFMFQISFADAENVEKKGFYLGLSPIGLAYFQSLSDPSDHSFGYGLAAQLGGHVNEKLSIYAQIETMFFVAEGDETALISILLELSPAVKYRFLKDKNWFLTGGAGLSYASSGTDSQVAAQHSLFLSTGIGYDFRIKKRVFVAPELNLKFYPNQNQNNPFDFSDGRRSVDQAIQTKFVLNFGWYF